MRCCGIAGAFGGACQAYQDLFDVIKLALDKASNLKRKQGKFDGEILLLEIIFIKILFILLQKEYFQVSQQVFVNITYLLSLNGQIVQVG